MPSNGTPSTTELIDGVFYVSPATAQVLQRHFARG